MKIYLAGVPGGGSTGDCKRERVKFLLGQKIVVISLD